MAGSIKGGSGVRANEPKLPSITRETKDAWGIEHGGSSDRRGEPKVSKLIKGNVVVSGNSGDGSLELSAYHPCET